MMDGEITKGLRDILNSWAGRDRTPLGRHLKRAADRIDEEAREDRDVSFSDGFTKGIEIAIGGMGDEDLAEHGLVRLPVGADGETIRPNDVLESEIAESDTAIRAKTLVLGDGGWGISAEMVENCSPRYFRHHKPTPAERIREWVDRARDDHAYFKDLLEIADELEGTGADA